MPTHIPRPTHITAAGTKPKVIEEFIGRVNSRTDAISIAHMRSPPGWVEPAQTPEFDESFHANPPRPFERATSWKSHRFFSDADSECIITGPGVSATSAGA